MNKKIGLILMPVLLAAVVFGLSACKSASEKAAEKLIEKSTNGQADVDVSGNSVKVNTNSASWETGDKISLPDGFPSDIYVVEGTIKTAVTSKTGSDYVVSLESTKSLNEVKALYDTKLKENGWTITTSGAIAQSFSYLTEKADRALNIGISEADGKTIVTLTTFKKTAVNAPATPDDNTNEGAR